MERIELADEAMENVVGGNIVFSSDHTTCGLNCNNQAKVLNYSGCLTFIQQNQYKMSEGEMLRKMVSLGLIARL